MRNVTPLDPMAVAKILNGEDALLRYVDGQFKKLREETISLICDVSLGIQQRMAKSETRFEKLIYQNEESIKELWRAKARRGTLDKNGLSGMYVARLWGQIAR